MLESFAMNRPMNHNEIDMFLRSLSCAEICQEMSTAVGSTIESRGEVHQSNRIHENPPTFCCMETSSDRQFNVQQSNVGDTNKGGFKICVNTLLNNFIYRNSFIVFILLPCSHMHVI